ncbi:MAG: phosphatase PAP2 family protein, partial [Bacilli bacterium]
LGTSLALSFPHILAITVCLALLIVLARLYAGLHYVTDVVAGGTIGAVVAVVWWLLLYRVL